MVLQTSNRVLILILLEYGLRHDWSMYKAYAITVLILILLEYGLRRLSAIFASLWLLS